MGETYLTITSSVEGLYKEKGSKFISYAYHVESVEEAKSIVARLKKEHHKAKHVCYAYRIGKKGETYRAADDGEPGGTAGRPILRCLESRDLTDSMVAVVRYFGGTLLGTGGLMRAYKAATEDALSKII